MTTLHLIMRRVWQEVRRTVVGVGVFTLVCLAAGVVAVAISGGLVWLQGAFTGMEEIVAPLIIVGFLVGFRMFGKSLLGEDK